MNKLVAVKRPILCVKDRALDTFGNPFVQQTTAQAVRGFTDEVNSDPSRSAVAQHPDDYDLYIIGHYHDETAEITNITPPELVVRGKDLIRPKGE